IEKVAEEQAEKYPNVKIVTGISLDELDAALMEMDRVEGLPAGTCGGHACDWETSIMMLIDEDYVRRDKLQKGYVGQLNGELLDRFFNQGVGSVSPIGVMGDPTGANPERGRRYFKYLQELQAECIRRKLGED
ncbi:MAG: creatininase family protein, partial [Clostridiales bacterium]|nr:creatininase family protein [Clostridiales bacterium]